MKTIPLLPAELIQNRILLLRGQGVSFDADLAALYGVLNKQLNPEIS
jgi:hypothetical protein